MVNREPSGSQIDKRMTEAIIVLKKKSLGYGYYHEEAIKLERAQKYWRQLREEKKATDDIHKLVSIESTSEIHINRLDAPENEDEDYMEDEI